MVTQTETLMQRGRRSYQAWCHRCQEGICGACIAVVVILSPFWIIAAAFSILALAETHPWRAISILLSIMGGLVLHAVLTCDRRSD